MQKRGWGSLSSTGRGMDLNQDEDSQAAPILNHDETNNFHGETSAHQSERKVSGTSLAEMERVRKEIRQLQEKRAAAMMNEVVELQRERDSALGRIKILRQTLEGVCMSVAS